MASEVAQLLGCLWSSGPWGAEPAPPPSTQHSVPLFLKELHTVGSACGAVTESAAALNGMLLTAAGILGFGTRGSLFAPRQCSLRDSNGRRPVLVLSSMWMHVTCAHRVVCGWDHSCFT